MVHDLVGAAFIILPKKLRALIGDQALQANAQELQDQEVLVIVREPGVVVYAHLPIMAMEMDGTALNLVDGATTLRPIVGTWMERLKGKMKGQKKGAAKAHDLVTVVEPADKGGRHA